MVVPICLLIALLMVLMVALSLGIASVFQRSALVAVFMLILLMTVGSELVLMIGRYLIRANFAAGSVPKEKDLLAFPMPDEDEIAWLKQSEQCDPDQGTSPRG